MKAITTILAGALLSATIVPGAMAADRRPINAREHHEQVRIRDGVKSGELSMRQACSEYGLNFRTIRKIVQNPEPLAFRIPEPRPGRSSTRSFSGRRRWA